MATIISQMLRNVRSSSKLGRSIISERPSFCCPERIQKSQNFLIQRFLQTTVETSGDQQQPSTASPQGQGEGLTLSDSCVKRINQIATPDQPYLRVNVEGGGCSGFQYKFCFDSLVNSDDKIFERNGAKLIIDETSLEYLKGSTVEYHEELIRSAFRIASNPKAESGCSCGASFAIKMD